MTSSKVANFYAGFEGEPEVTLVRTGAETHVLNAWDGYFSQVLDAIEPGEDGQWHGVLLPYHLGAGWYDAEEFEVEDTRLFAAQLSELDASGLEPATFRFYEALRSFMQEAGDRKEKLLIRYF